MELEQRMQIVSATGFALQQCFVLKELFQVVRFKYWLFSHDADILVISLWFSLYQNGTKMWLKIFQTHQFRTSRPESLLVLVAGKTDYCLIMLQQGMLKVLLRRLHQPKDKTDNAPTLDVEASFPVFTTWGWRSPPEILLLNPFNILTVKPGAYKPRSWGVWGFVPKRISSRWSSMAHCQASQVRMLFMTFLIQHIRSEWNFIFWWV